ncbi:type VI secretion system tip protein VgrG [Pseudomonas xanthosomatis]|uniref:type VI secretion system Vgr family protein n=1 Tax=Pseudomonas xanthosomatis TaxID=2842356 RepID=UPI001C3C8DAE|nr:type VI secretion system tip protein TssI/VgrG [Pseudomonas xanthosomatis]QXH45423.1 type VI secretion system tip protein VgrG [Pseudomonas xanthosomatis]
MLHSTAKARFTLAFDHLACDFQVLSFTGREAISQPYRFELELVSEQPDIDLESLLHQQAFLTFGDDGQGIHGQVYQAAQSDAGQRLQRYRISLVPRLLYLSLRYNQRIFQQRTAAQIIATILQEHGITPDHFRFSLGTPCPPREYCVQYDESDLHFVQRLCEEEGLHYHFEHHRQGHLLAFGDDQTFFPRLARPTAYVQDAGLLADTPVIHQFGLRLETRTTRVSLRDYDFEMPRLLLEASHGPGASAQDTPDLEHYHYPGHFTDRACGRQLCQRALQRERADYCQAQGCSDEPGLASGSFMTLAGHPRREWNDLWLLTEVRHEGHQPQVLEESIPQGCASRYANQFLATPWSTFYRPPLEHEKPQVLGCQTAVVTGPAGEEIHCDEYGRVKVQFHWDREGQGIDTSSCWLRVASGWAGPGIGALAIPRVGMEVLVEFLEGDPDQPLVTGCLYHAEHPLPYPLPAHKTRSLFKTRSSPGGGGSNELYLEDRSGQEQIFIHAQRDWEQRIGNDQKTHVGHERHDRVLGNSFSAFQAEEHRTTHGDRKTEVRGNDHLSVGNDQHMKIGCAQLIEAGQEIHIKAGEMLVIEAGLELTLAAGGGFIKLDAGGVSLVGAQVAFNGAGAPVKGRGVAVELPRLPGLAQPQRAPEPLSELRQYRGRYQMTDAQTGKPLPRVPYVLQQAQGRRIAGYSDGQGRTAEVVSQSPEPLELLTPERRAEPVRPLIRAGEPGAGAILFDLKDPE